MQNGKDNLRELRILLRKRGTLFRVCKIIFTRQDASIYLVPYGLNQRYFCGGTRFSEHEVSKSFKFTTGTPSVKTPRLSIHESGQVHVRADNTRASITHIPHLRSLRGQHIATVCVDAFDGLSPFSGVPRSDGAERDFVFEVDESTPSGRLALYVNGAEAKFTCGTCPLTFTLRRPSIEGSLFVGLNPISQERLGDNGRSGVTIVSGWNPFAQNSEHMEFIFLRAN